MCGIPPKKAPTTEDEPTLADLFKLIKRQGEQLASITSKMSSTEKIENEVENIKSWAVSLKEEMKELHEAPKGCIDGLSMFVLSK